MENNDNNIENNTLENQDKKEKNNQNVDISGKEFNEKLEELTKLAKTTQLDYFFENTYCDIKDPNTEQWKTGLVIKREDDEVEVKYYYSNINKNVYKYKVSDTIDKNIALFRKFTSEENYYFNNAYQKMRENAITNQLIFEAKAALKLLNSMKDFSTEEFDKAFDNPLEMAQELRGNLYYILLNILNNNFNFEYEEEKRAYRRRKNPKRAAKEEAENEDKFDIENDIEVANVGYLINDFLNFSVKYLQWINSHPEIGRLLTFNYNFMLFDKECAFFACLFEFTLILNSLFRENKFFMTYRQAISECLKEEFKVEKVEFKISNTIYQITKDKGIDEILKGILVNKNQSLFVFEQLAKIISANGRILFDERDNIFDFYFNRVNNLTMNEQKFISFEDVENYCDKIRTLIEAVTIDNKEERNTDRIHLHFIYKLINSENLSLKIRGVALFSKLIKEEEIPHKSITYFIQQIHLVSKVILGVNINEEILKRSKEIFIYVLKDKNINNTRMVQTLYKELSNKNKGIAAEIKKILMNVTSYFNKDLQEYFLNEILYKIEIKDFTCDLTDILRMFCLNTKNENILSLLYKILLYNPNPDVVDEAIYSIKDIFKAKILNIEIIKKYLESTFSEVEKNDLIQCLKLFEIIIDMYEKELKNDIFELDKKKDIFNILLTNLEKFIGRKEINKPNNLYKDSDILFVRLRVIIFIYDILNYSIYDEHFNDLVADIWTIIMLADNELDKNIFCRFLIENIQIFFDNIKVRDYFYHQLLLDMTKNPPEKIVYNEIVLFNKFFYNVNSDKLLFLNNIIRVNNPKTLDGFDFLWQILKVNPIEKVKKSICSMLVYLCINPISLKNKKEIEEIWQEYYNRIYTMIKKHRNNDVITINNIVFLLQTFVDTINKDTIYIVNSIQKSDPSMSLNIQFIFSSKNMIKTIPIDIEKDRIFDIKEKISFYFKIPFKCIDIKLRNDLMVIPYEDEDKLFSSYLKNNKGDNIEIEIFETNNKIFNFTNNPKKLLLEDESIFNELFYYLGQYNKYNKTDTMNYYGINSLIYHYPTGKKMLSDVTTFKIWEQLKNDSCIYSKNYILKLIKSKISEEKWLEALKKTNKMERLFFNILSNFEITMDGKEKDHLNEIEFICLENLLYITDRTEDVKGSISYENMYNKCIELLYKIISNDTVENGSVLDALFSFMSNNKTEKTANLIIRNKNNYIKLICTDCLLKSSKLNNKNKQKVIDFFVKNDFGTEAFLGIFNYMLDSELLQQIVDNVNNSNSQTDDDSYFKGIIAFIKKGKLDDDTLFKQRKHIFFNINEILELIVKFVVNYSNEKDDNKNQVIMVGFLNILKEIMLQNERVLNNLKNDKKFFDFIFERCLFKESICIGNNAMLDVLFYILILLISNNSSNTEKVLKTINQNHCLSFWRSNKYSEWSLVSTQGKNRLGYIGLTNLGFTCYMNSVLQQLYNIKCLRNQIMVNSADKNKNPILYNLKYLFLKLKFSLNSETNPNFFFKSMTSFDNKKLNPKEQMDADEFFNLLIDKCQDNVFEETFQGNFCYTYICSECKKKSVKNEKFCSISLDIKEVENVVNSIENYFEDETLDGDNRYYCERCQRKVPATKKISITEIPKYLVLVLKRFAFDYDKNVKIKINSFCDVNEIIDMTPFYDGIEVDKGLNFNLSGMILHKGNAEFGHYYSIIYDDEKNKYIELNDNIINEISSDEVYKSACGTSKNHDSSSAYILFYNRNDENISNKEEENTIITLNDIKDKEIHDNLIYENKKSQISRIYFTEEYKTFIEDYVINYNWKNINLFKEDFMTKNRNYDKYPLKREIKDIINSNIEKILEKYKFLYEPNTLPYQNNSEIFKFFAKYFLFIFIRLANSSKVEEFLDIFKVFLNSDIKNSLWLIEQFSNIKVMEEFLIKDPIKENHFYILGLLYCAMINLYNSKNKDYMNTVNNFISLCIEIISRKLEEYQYYDITAIYTVLVRFVSFGEEAYLFLESLGIVNIIEVFFYKKHNKGNQNNIIQTDKYGDINESDLYYFPKIIYKEKTEGNELLVPDNVWIQDDNVININYKKEDCSPFIVLLCKFIIRNKEYMRVFKENDYSFCSSLFLESNNRICVAHLIHIFKLNVNDIEIINVVNQSILPLLLNIIEISEDNQINYLIYIFDYLCSFIDPGINNNNLFIIIKKYCQLIKSQFGYYLFTIFNIKNIIYLFKTYFSDKSDLIGQLEVDFRGMIKWLNDNPYPPTYYPGATKLYKTYDIDYSKTKISQMQYQLFMLEFKKKTTEIKQNIIRMLNGKFQEITEDDELEIYTDRNDYTNFKFSKGDLIKVNSKESIVEKVLDEMIYIKYTNEQENKNNKKWVWTNTSIQLKELHKINNQN